ncbi:MAG: sulfatase-like hydrolase/transferase [Candidatus Sumerlaeota bacterium]|nr:sulfatase-like hydrolase/transferase [Candidatus Sumerlaeota bacterium]
MINRRQFLNAAGATGAACLLANPLRSQPPAAGARRPNFVFILTDDQRYDAMGFLQREQGERARFPWFKSPNLDRIAAEGVHFRNAFVVNSLCAPSRATFLTGQYGHVNGIVNNRTAFPENNVTHASLMRAAGYKTGYIGKWHMGSQKGQRPGFDFSASFIGQGHYVDCPFEINGALTPTKGWIDDVSTDYALGFIRDNKDKPFSLTIGYKATHGPCDPPERRKNDFEGQEARTVPNMGAPAIYKGGAPNSKEVAAFKPDKSKTNLNYFRCLAAMDDNVGRILKALDDLKLADDTVVVFAGDNGYYLGEHGLGDKRSAYEESLRIPLLLRYPRLKLKGAKLNQMVLNVDLAPTWLDFAGLPVSKEMHGRSWRPLLEGKTPEDWRKAFFYCYFSERAFATPMTQAVRTETAKLIRYPGHDEWTELFDVKGDPYELKNLYKDPSAASLRKEMEAEFERQAKAIAFRVPDFADGSNQGEGGGGAEGGTEAGEAGKPLNAWVLDYRFDKDAGDKVADASGKGNDGAAKGAPLADGREGHKARRFDGQGYIEVPKTPSLAPNVAGWTIEIAFKSEKPDGILLARGGPTMGYCLHLENGCPVFTVVSQGKASSVQAKTSITGEWRHLVARITSDKRLTLEINGQNAGEAKLHAFITKDPNDSMQIGADLKSKVLENKTPPNFVGLIESVRLFSGEAK